jgi:electron transfer flavoprotein alpha subunit
MATVRQKAMPAGETDASRRGEIMKVDILIDPSATRTHVVETVKEKMTGIKLEDADVIVAGGRGMGGAEGFDILRELAQILKGTVGATRVPCDSGWMPSTAQIGLTGKVVTPELYIAVAISGASQHLAGCSGSKTIIAVNRDPEANIFKAACYGVIGDWRKVLPAFMDKLKELLES